MNSNAVEQARSNMIEQQIRPCEIIDERVLDTLKKVPREHYVPDDFRGLAFADTHVPLNNEAVMMKPLQEGAMLQALNIQPGDKVLEVGTGSGFVTACMSTLGGDVTSYEIDAELSAKAAAKLETQGIKAALRVGDVFDTPLHPQGYDVIAVTGSLPGRTEYLEALLAPGGRMFAIKGQDPVMCAMLVTRDDNGELHRQSICETSLPPLSNAPKPEAFTF